MIGRVKAAGGDAQMLNPPERGIRGNSHMIMQDKNHLQTADLILQWIGEHARKAGATSSGSKGFLSTTGRSPRVPDRGPL